MGQNEREQERVILERIFESPPNWLLGWCVDEEVVAIPSREERRVLWKRLDDDGRWEAASRWRTETARHFLRIGDLSSYLDKDGVPESTDKRIYKALAWAFVGQKFARRKSYDEPREPYKPKFITKPANVEVLEQQAMVAYDGREVVPLSQEGEKKREAQLASLEKARAVKAAKRARDRAKTGEEVEDVVAGPDGLMMGIAEAVDLPAGMAWVYGHPQMRGQPSIQVGYPEAPDAGAAAMKMWALENKDKFFAKVLEIQATTHKARQKGSDKVALEAESKKSLGELDRMLEAFSDSADAAAKERAAGN